MHKLKPSKKWYQNALELENSLSSERANMKNKTDTWRIFKIMSEFVEGFETLSDKPKLITMFGSARTKPTHRYYKMAYRTAKEAVKHDYGVVSGGWTGYHGSG